MPNGTLFEVMQQNPVWILPFAGIALVLLLIFRAVFNKLTPYNDQKMRRAGNKAARRTRLGAYLAYLIAMFGSLIMSEQSYQNDLVLFVLDGLVALPVFMLAYFALDLTILRSINNANEIELGNMAVATAEFCAYVGLGIIMNASFAGGGQALWQGMASAALFSGVGLLTLMLVYTAYTIAWALRGCSLDTQILRGNMAAAVEVGSLLLAMSITLWFSIVGDFTGWKNDLESYGIAAAYNIVAVSIGRSVAVLATRKLGRTRKTVHHGNMTKAVIVGATSIASGVLAGLYTIL